MFLLRSAFWLGLALVIIQPQGLDFGAQAAVDSAHNLAVQHVKKLPCDSIECTGGKVLFIASRSIADLSKASPMQDSRSPDLVPVPRPRPSWMG